MAVKDNDEILIFTTWRYMETILFICHLLVNLFFPPFPQLHSQIFRLFLFSQSAGRYYTENITPIENAICTDIC